MQQLSEHGTDVYADGRWTRSAASERIEVVNPSDGSPLGGISAGDPADARRAVAAAAAAFPGWAESPTADRAAAVHALADLIDEHADELAALAALDVGTPIARAKATVAGCAAITRRMAERVVELPLDTSVAAGIVTREPIGVVVAITPWNYPLYQAIVKLAPALAAGCTVVLKPSEVAPLQVLRFVELVDEAAILPPGVLNLVNGLGATVGEALVSHPDVMMVSLTGSTRAGARVTELAAPTVKRVALELGGKSPNVVLRGDVDLDRVALHNLDNLLANAGQTCTALTRLIVPRERLGEMEESLRTRLASVRAGDPFDPETTLGPLVSEPQRSRVRELVDRAVREGARVVEGPASPAPPAGGFFFAPVVLSGVDPASEIAQEEVFGPVLVVIPYDNDDDAVAIANHSAYGLSGCVWGDRDDALAAARRIQTGMVSINGARSSAERPFGGRKQSGNGRELGNEGLLEFFELKSISL
ncbi:aldehyde dehydrogenase family protein [Herbiconiux sp. A18JL235]|uniref:aldehyde dehydrogenase (NAD(+)) n=1 Tax=Herbiconiux sp. A18JL235 TaxID=3152363 RepID=A0AB39BFV2_9MICO